MVSFTCLYSELSSSLGSECVKYLVFSPWELSSSLDNKVEDLRFRYSCFTFAKNDVGKIRRHFA